MPEPTISELQTSEAIMAKVERETRLRMGCGESLKSPPDFARSRPESIPRIIDKGKGGLIGRLWRFLTRPQQP